VNHGLLAAHEDRGTLVMRYLHADRFGVPKVGTCVSAIEVLPGGRLRLHERWTWNGQQESHLSVLDEVTDTIEHST
jgi:hypothetical protein